ncbi:MAG: ABC transporter permease [Candidatus Eisenbacteria bacterium]|nr:ABC transporter permease [Candidatus Eisenbacteria bacterium]
MNRTDTDFDATPETGAARQAGSVLLLKLGGTLGVPLVALAAAFGAGALFIAAIGQDPGAVYARLLGGTFGDFYGFGQVLFKATPLIFSGLAVALAFKAGLFNIGAEGQLYVGAFSTAWVGFTLTGLPGVVLVPLCILAGALGGAAWGIIPGYLKARFGTHEVINTIMLNFIAIALTGYLVTHVYFIPETIHTPRVAAQAQIPRLEQFWPAFRGSPVNVSLFLALAAAALVYVFLWRTKQGFELRALGLNPWAAEYGGVGVASGIVMAMALSGGLAGLVGVDFVMGYKYYYEQGFSAGVGFMGIAVALLGRNHPLGVVLAALLFGALSYGGLVINSVVPKELVEILQAIVIVAVIVGTNLFGALAVSLKKRSLK